MEAIVTSLLTFFSFILIASGFWLLVIPVGIVFAILKAFKKVHYRWRSIVFLGFGGIGLFLVAFICTFLTYLLAYSMNIPIPEFSLPN